MEMYVFCEVGTEFLNLFTRILGFKRFITFITDEQSQIHLPCNKQISRPLQVTELQQNKSGKFVYIKIHLVVLQVIALHSLYVVTRIKHVGNHSSGHTVP
jgi:hypothetical protein